LNSFVTRLGDELEIVEVRQVEHRKTDRTSALSGYAGDPSENADVRTMPSPAKSTHVAKGSVRD
jgi:hypothetical protein